MVANHFDVRWVDGYSAVSDVPSSLAARIEKMAAELPSSGDRIELAVRDVRRSDGSVVGIGLLRFVVAVSSTPRPLGYLHAVVVPGGYGLDLDSWRALVARRYGEHPEERIRALYEELAESTRDSGRDRLHALAIRPEDVRDCVEVLDESERTPMGSKPTSRPPPNRPARAGTAPGGAKIRPSQPILRPSQQAMPMSVSTPVRVVSLDEASSPTVPMDALRVDDVELGNDVTQPMDAPSGTAAPLSGEHPQQVRAEPRPRRAWWMAGTSLGLVALLLAAVGWLGHRHRLLAEERDELEKELLQRTPDEDSWRQERKGLLEELERARSQTDRVCTERNQRCREDLVQANAKARADADTAEKAHDELRNKLRDADTRAVVLAKTKDELEAQLRTAGGDKQRASQLELENKQLRGQLTQAQELVQALCKGLQSSRKAPKECQDLK